MTPPERVSPAREREIRAMLTLAMTAEIGEPWRSAVADLLDALDDARAYSAQLVDEVVAAVRRLKTDLDETRKALDEREGDMHMRIRAGYDRTIADSWRAKAAETERERDAARAERDLAKALHDVAVQQRDAREHALRVAERERAEAIARAERAEAQLAALRSEVLRGAR